MSNSNGNDNNDAGVFTGYHKILKMLDTYVIRYIRTPGDEQKLQGTLGHRLWLNALQSTTPAEEVTKQNYYYSGIPIFRILDYSKLSIL